MIFDNITSRISRAHLNTRLLFLVDALGALLSVFLLGIVLVRFEGTFGMPRKTLYFLAAFPAFFMIYDLACYFGSKNNKKLLLKIIAYANISYCCLSFGLVIHHYQKLTSIGVWYFVLELVVVIILASLELKTATHIGHSQESGQ